MHALSYLGSVAPCADLTSASRRSALQSKGRYGPDGMPAVSRDESELGRRDMIEHVRSMYLRGELEGFEVLLPERIFPTVLGSTVSVQRPQAASGLTTALSQTFSAQPSPLASSFADRALGFTVPSVLSSSLAWSSLAAQDTVPQRAAKVAEDQASSLEPKGDVLHLRVVAARRLLSKDAEARGDPIDPYVVARLGKTEHRTVALHDRPQPMWSHGNTFSFPVDETDFALEIEAFNSIGNASLCRLRLALRDLPDEWARRTERFSEGLRRRAEVDLDVKLDRASGRLPPRNVQDGVAEASGELELLYGELHRRMAAQVDVSPLPPPDDPFGDPFAEPDEAVPSIFASKASKREAFGAEAACISTEEDAPGMAWPASPAPGGPLSDPRKLSVKL